MSNQRILLVGGVSLIKGRVREAGLAMKEICDELEPLLMEVGYVDNSPFKTISIIIRFGEKTDLTPVYGSFNKRYSELPVTVDMELSSLRMASKDIVKNACMKAVIGVLLDVAEKHGLPSVPFQS